MGKKKNATNQKKRRNKKPYSREKMMSDLLAVNSQLKEYEEAKFLNPEKKNTEKIDLANIIKEIAVHKPVQLSHTSEQEVDDLQKMIGTM